jgi:hypothetical protein
MQSNLFSSRKLNEEIRVRITVQRSVRGRDSDPEIGIVNISLSGLTHRRRRRDVIREGFRQVEQLALGEIET